MLYRWYHPFYASGGNDYDRSQLLYMLVSLLLAVLLWLAVNEAMMRSKKFMSLLPLIPAERLLLESDSPFIRFKTSHSNALLKLSKSIIEVKTNVALWGNFKALLQ